MARGPHVNLRWEGEKLKGIFHDAALRGLLLGGEHLLQVSRDLVPIDEGVLERSGAVSHDEQNLVVAVSYDTPYAVDQHENPVWRHAPGRTWKYLEHPFNAEADVIRALLFQQMRRVAR